MSVYDAQPVNTEHVGIATLTIAWEMTKLAASVSADLRTPESLREEFANNYAAVNSALASRNNATTRAETR